jgi:transposase InsO family protein
MDQIIKTRLGWVKFYKETSNAGLVCRRCGVSRPTLRKWVRRYEEHGMDGLADRSKKPKTSPRTKVTTDHEELILDLRKKRKLGARRIKNELSRLHNLSFSLATIHKVLTRNAVNPLKRTNRKKKYKRYQRPSPGDRLQLDTCKIAPGFYQYTAIDDCTGYRVLGLYKRRNASNTLLFLEKMIEETPFSIQRIQTDRGFEFFSTKVQQKLMEYCIKCRPIRPGSPHLNGKVERSQRTDLDEFYETVDINSPDLEDQLQEWQHYYNWNRPHGSLSGKTPMDRYFEVSQKALFWDQVEAMYDPIKERVQEQNYQHYLRVKKLKPSM